MAWNFRGKEDNSVGDGKANIWQINVCWAMMGQWDTSGLWSCPTTPSLDSLQVSLVIALFWLLSKFFRQGFPGGAPHKNPPASAGGHGSDPWFQKIPHAKIKKKDSTCLGAAKPTRHSYWVSVPKLLKPRHLTPVLCNRKSQGTARRSRTPPSLLPHHCWLQLEKTHAKRQTSSSTKV